MSALRGCLLLGLSLSMAGWRAVSLPDGSMEQAASMTPAEQLETGLDHVAAERYEQARRWFESAAAAGESRAKLQLGWLHESGLLGTADGAAAIDWYTRGVAAGESAYAVKLAWMHLQGQGTQADLASAEGWFRHAIAAGHVEANVGLGSVLLAEVIGGDLQRIDEALLLFEAALAQGVMLGSYYLGRIYREGLGVAPDPQRALAFFEIGAEAGLAEVQWLLAEMHAEGVGTDRDLIVAAKWAYLAAANGVEVSLTLIRDLEGLLDDAELAEARRRAWLAAGGSP